MSNYMEDFEEYKDKIPEFIVKLYHILEQKQYNDFLCWHGDNEILIKSGKKLEEKVLPHFFRHRHLSSFIRQLNMYKFSKSNKMTKEKNHMYFRNEHFKRGQIKEMTKIKRNNKKSRKEDRQDCKEENSPDDDHISNQSEISIDQQLEKNEALNNYKLYVKNTIREIAESIKKVEAMYPDTKQELSSALALCNEISQIQEVSNVYSMQNIEESLQNKNMLSTMRLLPRIESLIFPSQLSFYQFT